MKPLTHLVLNDCDIAPGAEWKDAGPGWRIILVRKGCGYWIARGEIRELNPGDVLVLGPGIEGAFRASQIGAVSLRYFYFWPEHLGGLLSPADRFSLKSCAQSHRVRIISVNDPIAAEFAALASQSEKRRNFDYRCRVLHLVAMIFGDAMPGVGVSTGRDPVLSRFEEIISSIPDAELINLSAAKLAQLCGCSLRHLRRMFRKRFKTSIRARQTELRLERARQLLVETNDSVAGIASATGYHHLGFFNLMFKKKVGMTPTQWRQLHRVSSDVTSNKAEVAH